MEKPESIMLGLSEAESREKEDSARAIAKREAKGQPFAKLTGIEFKRVILRITGELVGFDTSKPKKWGARFVNRERTRMFYPAHFDIAEDGKSFELTMNIMCSRGEKPIVSGKYALVIFERYEGHGKEKHYKPSARSENVVRCGTVYTIEYDGKGNAVSKKRLTDEYPCFISPELEGSCSGEAGNPRNFILEKPTSHFIAVSETDMDTAEYFLSVDYKEPPPPQTFRQRHRERHSARMSDIKKDLTGMKEWIYQKAFRFFSKFAKHGGNIILFCSGSRAEIGGNEEFIYKRMVERGLDKQYSFRFDFKASINEKRSVFSKFRFYYYLATSDVILLDDYYPEIYKFDYAKDVKVLQVWHACGAFKTLGFERVGKPGEPPFNTRVHKCYTHVPVSSEHSAKHHAEGFAIDERKFYPVGIPRTDIFFDDEYKKVTRERMLDEFPACRSAKKVYLYAPTFRGDNVTNAYFPFDKFDLEKWGEFLEKEGSVLIVKLHPFVRKRVEIPERFKDRILDATDYREVNDILFIIDVLITDYSSIIYETSLLGKPMLFFAFDRRYYEATRDFYEPYEELVPGRIVGDFDELLEAMEKEDYDFHKMDAFVRKNFKYTDGRSTDRVIDQLIMGKQPDEG